MTLLLGIAAVGILWWLLNNFAQANAAAVAKALPFYGAGRLFESAVVPDGPVLGPVVQAAVYGLALLLVARLALVRRLSVQRHAQLAS